MAGAFRRRDEPLPQLPEKPLALNANFFREVVRRIESIVPKARQGGVIKVTKPSNLAEPGLFIELNAEIRTLNVCENGEPSTIRIYAEKQTGST